MGNHICACAVRECEGGLFATWFYRAMSSYNPSREAICQIVSVNIPDGVHCFIQVNQNRFFPPTRSVIAFKLAALFSPVVIVKMRTILVLYRFSNKLVPSGCGVKYAP